ncbi:MAG: energy transducer TonB [Pseudomonadota bacterium]
MVQAFRLVPSAGLAGAVTFVLVFVMQYLISTGQSAIVTEVPGQVLNFVRVPKEEIVEVKPTKPQKPPQPETPPPKITRMRLDPTSTTVALTHSAPVTSGAGVGITASLGLAAADGEYLPIIKVAPVYPRRALERGLEGDVIVAFTVTRQGTVRDVSVVESTRPLFNQAAIAAAEKFKYKPRVVNGVPIEVAGVKNRISFRLEN